MSAEIWILLIVLASLAAAGAGFAYARRGAPTKEQLDVLRKELDVAQQQSEKMKADVAGHFEQSAVLFGRLAHDYRAFLEHFSESARELGISDSTARELLERADQPLLGSDSDIVDTQQKQQTDDSAPAASAEIAQNQDTGQDETSSSADMLAETQLPETGQTGQDTGGVRVSESIGDTRDETAREKSDTRGSSAPAVNESTAEPPLIDDVVGVERTKTTSEPDAATETTTGVVVDVDLESDQKRQSGDPGALGEDKKAQEEEDTRRHG